jgi:uncharacterized damage-inducible protein DinB
MSHLPLLASFNEWVNRRLYELVAALPEEDYRAERGLFFGSIHRTLNHLLVVDRLWSGRIAGVDRGIRSLSQLLHDDFAALREARMAEDRSLVELVGGLERDGLDRVVEFRTIDGRTVRARADHLLLGLFNHQTHHRGQISAVLTQQGVAWPDLDVVFFLAETGQVSFA